MLVASLDRCLSAGSDELVYVTCKYNKISGNIARCY